jgi:hypothetical protein
MDDPNELITQLGLLLTQLRYVRRAIENIENSTAHYGGVTFAVAVAAGPKFGEPPLLNGALKVYVVNINDLNVSSGMGFFESLLGGIGRFFGGLAGGLVGGTIGGVALVVIFNKINEIVANLKVILPVVKDIVSGVDRILDKLGIGANKAVEKTAKEGEKEAGTGSALSGMLPTLEVLTGLFTAASAGPDKAARNASDATTESARTWKETLTALTATLTIANAMVRGLVLLVPELIGGLAWLLVRLDAIKLALLELLQFGLRFVLLLRGVTLVTIYDTVSAVASLAASLLATLQTMFSSILDSIFAIIASVASAVEAFIKFVGGGLKNAIDSVMNWLVNGLGAVLTYIGNLKVFQLLTHLVVVLPNMLPAIGTLMGTPITGIDLKMLQDAAKVAPPGPPGVTTFTPTTIAPADQFPDIGAKFLDKVTDFKKALDDTKTTLTDKSTEIFKTVKTGLTDIDGKMKAALTQGEADFNTRLSADLKTVGENATTLAGALTPAVDAARTAAEQSQQGGLGRLADAYEKWLTGEGFKALMTQISTQFAQTTTLPSAAVQTAAPDPLRAPVEIKELIIDLKPAVPTKTPPPVKGKTASLGIESLVPGYDEDEERGA